MLTDDERAVLLDALDAFQELVDNNADTNDAERERVDGILTSIEKKTTPSVENDTSLALWFTPVAIREHFDGASDDDEIAQWVNNASDEQLVSMGHNCLSSDILYATFHEVMVLDVEWAIKHPEEEA